MSHCSWHEYIQVKFGQYIHTYIHNWSLQIFSSDCNLVSCPTYDVSVYFTHEYWKLKSTLLTNNFWETFHGSFISCWSFCQKTAERKSPKKYFSHFISLELDVNNRPTDHLLNFNQWHGLYWLSTPPNKKNFNWIKWRDLSILSVRWLCPQIACVAY